MDRYNNVWETDNLDSILGLENNSTASDPIPSTRPTHNTNTNNDDNNSNDDTISQSNVEHNLFSNSTYNNTIPDTSQNYQSLSQCTDRPLQLQEQQHIPIENSMPLLGIPEAVLNVYHAVSSTLSDFSFVYVISAQLCQDIMPMECYVEFKMGLLLSLASIQADSGMAPIHIVGIGQDTSFANTLMTKVGNLAKRFITSLEKGQSSSLKNENTVDASPVLLASGGVYFVGDLPTMNDTRRGKVFRDITCGNVSVDNTFITYPLDTAIWCYWSNYRNNIKDMKSFGALLKVFGIPFVLQETSSEKFTDFLLEQAMISESPTSVDSLSISMDNMQHYIAHISSQNVEMPGDCADLLQRYFVASRLDRPGCLPEKAYVSLKQMSESFAKLSFRNYVTSVDAIGAIYLSEHFIFHTFGAGIFPPPILVVGNEVENVEIMIRGFSEWLTVYLTRFNPNSNTPHMR